MSSRRKPRKNVLRYAQLECQDDWTGRWVCGEYTTRCASLDARDCRRLAAWLERAAEWIEDEGRHKGGRR
jgi:hypothetical protein